MTVEPPTIDHTYATPIYHGMVSNYESIQYQIDKRIDSIKFDNKQFTGSPHWLSEGGFGGDVIKDFGFNALSKDVTRDMTQAITKVDEKVGVFNQQVEEINKSQNSFSFN